MTDREQKQLDEGRRRLITSEALAAAATISSIVDGPYGQSYYRGGSTGSPPAKKGPSPYKKKRRKTAKKSRQINRKKKG